MSARSRLLTLQLAFLLGVCCFLFFFGLGAFGLVGADEPRYAQIAREMFQRHDWILPTLNGQPWLEKPVLLYWKIINSYRIFGVHDWAARLPSAFHATALVVVVFFFMRRFRPGSEMDAALITASSAFVIGFARGASTDMPLSADFGIAMMAWWAWHETNKKLWLAFFFVLLGAGTLAKGPVGPALALLIVAAYAWLHRDGKSFLDSLWIPGFLLFFVIALPWYIAVQIRDHEFFRIFFLEHNLERFGTNLYRHSQPFWYYLPVFLLATLPWTVFTVPALIQAVRDAIRDFRRDGEDLRRGNGHPTARKPRASGTPGATSLPAVELSSADATIDQQFAGDGLEHFLCLWTIIPLIVFSISRSKLPGYILPGIPAAALLTANYLQRKSPVGRLHLMAHSLVCGAVMAAAMMTPWFVLKQPVPGATRAIIAITTGVIASLVLIVVRRSGQRALHFATMVPVVLGLAFLLRPAANALDNALSARIVDADMRQLGIGKTPIAVFRVKREVAYGINFYRNQTVTYYESGVVPDLPSGIPPEQHVVIAREGSQPEIEAKVAPRQVTRLGELVPQHLEFFLVSNSR